MAEQESLQSDGKIKRVGYSIPAICVSKYQTCPWHEHGKNAPVDSLTQDFREISGEDYPRIREARRLCFETHGSDEAHKNAESLLAEILMD